MRSSSFLTVVDSGYHECQRELILEEICLEDSGFMKITKKTIRTVVATAMATVLTTASTVFADGDLPGDVGQKLTNAKNLLYEIIALGGGIVVALSMIKIYQGTKNGDDNKTDQGVTGLIVGILMGAIGGVMTFIGFN